MKPFNPLAKHTEALLDLSTSHIPKHTAEALGDEAGFRTAPLYEQVVYTPWADYGWIFWAGEQSPDIEEEHPELLAALKFAKSHGYDYLKLDCDAAQIPDLPTFQW